MNTTGRRVSAVLLLLAAVFCIYQAVSAGEFPRSAWAYWLIDGAVGLAAVLGAIWLLRLKRPAV